MRVDDLLNYFEAADILGVTRMTVYNMIQRGELHPFEIADRRYLFRDEVERIKMKKRRGHSEHKAKV